MSMQVIMLTEEKQQPYSKLISNKGIAVTGNAADGRQIVNRAREEAQNYKVLTF